MKRAAFLDRDGTLIADPGYVTEWAQVRLLPGVPAALRRLRAAGYLLVVVTNQSAVARGLCSEEQVRELHRRLGEELARAGAGIDAFYYSPYHPDGVIPAYRRDHPSRKPAPGMLQAAATDLGLDLPASFMIGDSLRDVEAGRAAGCRTVLLAPPTQPAPSPAPDFTAPDLPTAVRLLPG